MGSFYSFGFPIADSHGGQQRVAKRPLVLESAQPNNLDNRSRFGKGKHMRFRPVLLLAVLSALIGIAGADAFKPPPMKDGLWETHSTQTQQGKSMIDTSVKMCQSKELTKSLQSNGE